MRKRFVKWLKWLWRQRLGRAIARLLGRIDDAIEIAESAVQAAKNVARRTPEGPAQMQALARQAGHEQDLARLKRLRALLEDGQTLSRADQQWLDAFRNREAGKDPTPAWTLQLNMFWKF